MADLIVSYFDRVDSYCAGAPIKSETVVTSATSAVSANIPTQAEVCCLFSTAAHYVTIGNGTPVAAAANSFYVPANQQMWLRTFVAEGQSVKIAAITA